MRNGKTAEYCRVATIQKLYEISDTTLRNWGSKGLIRTVKTQGNNNLYNLSDVNTLLNLEPNEQQRKTVGYCRVSSQKQSEDLKRQIETIQKENVEEIISDIGSGINFKKPGIKKLLQLVMDRKIRSITLSDKDRLCRFGYELFESICEYTNTEIILLHQINEDTRELADDLLSICNVFVAKKNGLRASRNRRERKELQLQESKIETNNHPEKLL